MALTAMEAVSLIKILNAWPPHLLWSMHEGVQTLRMFLKRGNDGVRTTQRMTQSVLALRAWS